ncbi:SDR family oxidoreductase [Georgenia faecalis]|uniref:SDR family oxidoreductase n=1 Tax=Georgenia faecalis TaxID=2483799 RepID=A0ABV9DAT5_9MICO|nr:NAD(P)H-binding protein [Georgenia faecalis]
MATTMLVTGGTGTLGRHLLPLLAGAQLRVLSRRAHPDDGGIVVVRGDTVKGEGLDDAVDGVAVVVHLAGGPKGDDVGARNVAAAARRAGVRHLVLISVVGADRMPLGYFRAKEGAERAVRESGVPVTILRAAQFHDLVLRTVGAMARLPLVPVPRDLRVEPVEAAEVAARLAELALGPPRGRVPDLVGPEVLGAPEILASLLEARRTRRPTVTVPLPGAAGRAYRRGLNLAGADAQRGRRTWAAVLADRAATGTRV